jgi:AcrR family transcriptional regulator
LGEATPASPQRADAQRNHEKLLAAAQKEFRRAKSEASLEEIARQAGVGIGTLYRHFPTREALILAAHAREVDQLAALTPKLLAELPPERALREWLDRLAAMGRTKQWMGDALSAIPKTGNPPRSEAYRVLAAALTRLLEASVAAGAIRDDIGADDVILAMSGLWRVNVHEDGWQGRTERVLDLLMDGLRVTARSITS